MHSEPHTDLDNLNTVQHNLRNSAKGSNDDYDVTVSLTDDVQASEEVGDEEAILAKALPSPIQPTLKEIQEDVLTHFVSSIVV